MSATSTIPEFVITRVFDAQRDIVYAAWTEPRHMAHWWGPREFTTPACEMDVRPGGAYRVVMRGADGVEYPITGIYREVVKSERLVMTMDCSGHPAAWHDLNGKTRLTVHVRFGSIAIRDAMLKMGMHAGWSQSLERLAELTQPTITPPMNTQENPASTADREIVTTRVFNASRDLVWQAWTDPKHLVQWWGPDGFTTTMQVMDVRPGGEWRFIMHGPDGRNYQNDSVYVEVEKPSRLVYDHVAPKFRATATFEEQGEGTRVTLRMVFESVDVYQTVVKQYGAVEGAQQTFQRLADHLARK